MSYFCPILVEYSIEELWLANEEKEDQKNNTKGEEDGKEKKKKKEGKKVYIK